MTGESNIKKVTHHLQSCSCSDTSWKRRKILRLLSTSLRPFSTLLLCKSSMTPKLKSADPSCERAGECASRMEFLSKTTHKRTESPLGGSYLGPILRAIHLRDVPKFSTSLDQTNEKALRSTSFKGSQPQVQREEVPRP